MSPAPEGDLAAALAVPTLGPCRIDSPLRPFLESRRTSVHYVEETDRVLFHDTASSVAASGLAVADLPGFEPAGPRKRIFFDPAKTRVGIVTCGGLCPGINDCILGTSRGGQDPEAIVDCLERMNISALFVVGGDGTLRGAMAIARVIADRALRIAVVGVPKTIDNDIPYIDQSFGFQTAFGEAAKAIQGAHVEAKASPNGVGLVKLMGRHSGFIACYAALAQSDANVVLIPEVPFCLDGPGGLLEHLLERVKTRGHAVIVAAEGAGQELMPTAEGAVDASGNRKLLDIGRFLQTRITDHFATAGIELNLKYIDPSYAVRSVRANPYDSVYCLRLAQNAVHAAMAGRTELVVGRYRGRFVHIPMPLAVSHRNQVAPDGDLWLAVLEATGQPPFAG